tara:strand:- start:825 stop:2045 length:1221 start_codon:yes stop_codon:yes gene_type:complete
VILEKNLKLKNSINITSSTKFSYKIFPTPRIIASGVNFKSVDDIFEMKNSEISILLKINKILDFNNLDYRKLIISGGDLLLDIKNINKILNYIKKNNKEIFFDKNKILLTRNEVSFINIDDARIKINIKKIKKELILKGLFLNNRITLHLSNLLDEKTRVKVKIPNLNTNIDIFFEKDVNRNNYNGTINLKFFNNLLFLKFLKEKYFKIKQGYIRNDLVSSSIAGSIITSPSFFLDLNLEPNYIRFNKIFNLIKLNFFSENYLDAHEIIKKINGTIQFQKNFNGTIYIENNKVSLKNFMIASDNTFLVNARFNEYGEKGKIRFELIKKLIIKKKGKVESFKNIEISGYIIPFDGRITLNQISLDKVDYSDDEVEGFERKLNEEVINNSIDNLFNKPKINDFFKNFN